MDKKSNKALKEIIEERVKWRHFFEILTRKYVFIPILIVAVYLIDNPDIAVLSWIVKLFKRLAGIH